MKDLKKFILILMPYRDFLELQKCESLIESHISEIKALLDLRSSMYIYVKHFEMLL